MSGLVAPAWLCLLAPLAATILITLLGERISRRAAAWLATTSVFVAFGGAVATFAELWSRSPGDRTHVSVAWTWLQAGNFKADLSILIDPLAVYMMLVVSGVGALIVLYSIGYMDGDDEERRYFAYISFFVFSMLLLVQGGNLLILLAGWGLVGLSSYLLIGFWHERPSAVAAAKKAFVMNAFGDATMALAFFVLIQHSNSLNFATSFATSARLSQTTVDLVALGLLGGAVAKSAQIPLQTWLPDAMEGPTPVSALIHAATMVTAGVYLIARTAPIFEQARVIELIAAGLGALTLLVAGLIALVQTDIKRVIAYSTMSQIGYMFLGAGLGAYANGEFHLMTHAFFKALLFMTAGLVIHAVADEQDIRKLRGVGSLMPFTRVCFLVGTLALVGLPPFAGFFSKDEIVAAAAAVGTWWAYVLWGAALAGALLTGLYAFRLYWIVFPGEPTPFVREHHHRHDGKEGPWTMLIPVGLLTVLSVIGGFIQFAPIWTPITDWLAPSVRTLAAAEPTDTQVAISSALTVGLGLLGTGIAWYFYRSGVRHPLPGLPSARRLLEHKFYFDELYAAVFYRPASVVASALLRDFEEPVVLAAGPELGEETQTLGRETRRLQTGLLRTYALALGAGAVVLVAIFLGVR
jgi:NADH-quinone oxidoreductase subunit L